MNLSGRDICDLCKDAERKWASKYIRKEVSTIIPDISVYIDATKNRLAQMTDSNLRMDYEASPYAGSSVKFQQPMAYGGK